MMKKRVFNGSPVRPHPTPAPDGRSPLRRLKDRLLTIGRKILRRASASKAQGRTPPREEEEEAWCMFSDGGEPTKRRIVFEEDFLKAREAFEQRELQSALQEVAEEDAEEPGCGEEYRDAAVRSIGERVSGFQGVRSAGVLIRGECWEKGPTNLGIEESVTAFSWDSDPVMVSLEFALDA